MRCRTIAKYSHPQQVSSELSSCLNWLYPAQREHLLCGATHTQIHKFHRRLGTFNWNRFQRKSQLQKNPGNKVPVDQLERHNRSDGKCLRRMFCCCSPFKQIATHGRACEVRNINILSQYDIIKAHRRELFGKPLAHTAFVCTRYPAMCFVCIITRLYPLSVSEHTHKTERTLFQSVHCLLFRASYFFARSTCVLVRITSLFRKNRL